MTNETNEQQQIEKHNKAMTENYLKTLSELQREKYTAHYQDESRNLVRGFFSHLVSAETLDDLLNFKIKESNLSSGLFVSNFDLVDENKNRCEINHKSAIHLPSLIHIDKFKSNFGEPAAISIIDYAKRFEDEKLRKYFISELIGNNSLYLEKIKFNQNMVINEYIFLICKISSENNEHSFWGKPKVNTLYEENHSNLKNLIETTQKYHNIVKSDEFKKEERNLITIHENMAKLFTTFEPKTVSEIMNNYRMGNNLNIK